MKSKRRLKPAAFFLTFLVFTAIGLQSCKDKSGEKAPDVSGIKLKIESSRFDKDIFSIDTNHIGAGLKQLHDKYPWFADFFIDTIMGFGLHANYSDTSIAVRLAMHEFLTHNDYRGLYDTINAYYPDTKDLDNELTKAFQYLKYYFPESKVPHLYYINWLLTDHSAFLVGGDNACVSLDMFLGAQYPYYASVGLADYLAPKHKKEYIPVALMDAVYLSKYPFIPEEHSLLELMIERGKEQYFLHKVLPAVQEDALFAITPRQLDWCKKNEAMIFNYFITQNLLFNKEDRRAKSYVFEGPFAAGIGSATDPDRNTPGNIGSFSGYKMVCAYMDAHPETTLKQLLELKMDAAKFMELAKYKPR